MRITQAELLDALADAMRGTQIEDARTIPEIAAELGMSVARARAALKVIHAQGRLVVHRATRTALDGRQATVPAYTIQPPKARP